MHRFVERLIAITLDVQRRLYGTLVDLIAVQEKWEKAREPSQIHCCGRRESCGTVGVDEGPCGGLQGDKEPGRENSTARKAAKPQASVAQSSQFQGWESRLCLRYAFSLAQARDWLQLPLGEGSGTWDACSQSRYTPLLHLPDAYRLNS